MVAIAFRFYGLAPLVWPGIVVQHFLDPVALFLLFLCFRYVYLFVVLLVSRGRYPLQIFFLLLLCINPVLGIRSPMFSKSDDGYDND